MCSVDTNTDQKRPKESKEEEMVRCYHLVASLYESGGAPDESEEEQTARRDCLANFLYEISRARDEYGEESSSDTFNAPNESEEESQEKARRHGIAEFQKKEADLRKGTATSEHIKFVGLLRKAKLEKEELQSRKNAMPMIDDC